MKLLSVLFLVSCLTAQVKYVYPPQLTGLTVANLPAAAVANRTTFVTDGNSSSDCTAGGGSNVVLCRDTGSAWVAVGGGVPSSRAINTTSPVTGGGDLSADRTIACATCGVTGASLAQFAATTSAQLLGVLNDETGSGLAVFNNGPTLIAPILGTPASGTLTNATGYLLSAVAAATGANTIANGDNAQIWNWATTTSGKIGFTFGETTASTSAGTPYLLKAVTLAGSTATPLNIVSSLTGSQVLPSLSITPTWNTTGLVDAALLVDVTNTASATGSLLMNLKVGGVSKLSADKAGNVVGLTFTSGSGTVLGNGLVSAINVFTQSGGAYNAPNAETMTMKGSGTALGASVWAYSFIPGATMAQTSGSGGALKLNPTYNQASGTAANTDLLINRVETAVGSGAQLFQDWQVGGSSKASLDHLGALSTVSHALTGDVALPFVMAKTTQSATAPGAAKCVVRVEAGTNANTGKYVAYCGTSTTGVTIVDNVGSGF